MAILGLPSKGFMSASDAIVADAPAIAVREQTYELGKSTSACDEPVEAN